MLVCFVSYLLRQPAPLQQSAFRSFRMKTMSGSRQQLATRRPSGGREKIKEEDSSQIQSRLDV